MFDAGRGRLKAWFCLALLAWSGATVALTPDQAVRIAAGESDARLAALSEVVAAVDPALGAYLQALLADEVKLADGKAFIVRDGKAVEAASGLAVTLPEGAEDVVNNNRMRQEFEGALAALKLFSPDRAERAKAIVELKDQAGEGNLVLIEKAEKSETDAELKVQLALLKAAVLITSPDKVEAARRGTAALRQRPAGDQVAAHRAPGPGRRDRPPRCAPRSPRRSTRCSRAWPGASAWACSSPA